MLLVVDVGNTNAVLGLYKGAELLGSWRMGTESRSTADETGMFLHSLMNRWGYAPEMIENVIISSVVPDSMYSLTHGIKKYYGIDPMVVSHRMRLGITAPGEAIREIGNDRLVNAVGALQLYGGPVIVIDYGTATTYDAIGEEGEFLTGLTAPGIKISAEALFTKAALLGKVELSLPPTVIATNTTESLQCGILYGRIGETEYIVSRMKKELGLADCKVVATGGLARVIAVGTDVFDVINPMLTLEGLRLIYEMNS